jgi:hypothetical protein
MAANSDVEIVNMALVMLGARPIAALDEGTKAATLASEIFDTERDATLQAHEWNFALKRTSLAKDAAAPPFGFGASYQLPSDYLRVVEVSPDCIYRIEGKKLLTDETAISIRYLRQVTSPSEWSPQFKSVFAARLAWRMSYPLTEQVSKMDRAEKTYAVLLAEARTIDSQESGYESALGAGADVLINARPGIDGLAVGYWWQR